MPQPFGSLSRVDHIIVAGMPHTGKTPFASELVEGGPAARAFGFTLAARRVVYFNSGRGWGHLGEKVTAEDLADPGLLEGVCLRLVVEPGQGDELLASFAKVDEACRVARACGGLVLVVDELADLNRAGGEPILRGLHRNGHHDGVATIFCSPCWTDFPARCRSTASRVFSFFQRSDDDVRTLDAELGRQVPGFGARAASWRFPQPPVAWVSPALH